MCWIHEGRHYKKLNPLVAYHQKLLDNFLTDFWNYYRELLAYRDAPSPQAAEKLRAEFYHLFDSETGYQQLDERKRLTATKISELLLVLEHPELPLHNNPAELGARTMVQRRNISYATQTSEGTKAYGTFLCLWLPRLVSWESVFLNTCVTAFLRWAIFPLWEQLFANNLLFIPLLVRG